MGRNSSSLSEEFLTPLGWNMLSMDMLFCKTAQEEIFRCSDKEKLSQDAKTFLKQGEMLCQVFCLFPRW